MNYKLIGRYVRIAMAKKGIKNATELGVKIKRDRQTASKLMRGQKTSLETILSAQRELNLVLIK